MKTITKIHIKGFRSLRDVTFEPGPITVMIGANGSGKSNLLAFLRLLPLLRTRSLRRFVADLGGADSVLFRTGRFTPELTAEVEFRNDRLRTRYDLRLARTQTDALAFVEEGVSGRTTADAPWARTSLGVGHNESRIEEFATSKESTREARSVRRLLSRISFFHFHDTSSNSPLRSTGRANDSSYLRSDGSNLAPYLLRLKQSQAHRAEWAMLSGLVHRIAPYIKELMPTPVNADPDTFRLDDPDGAADQVSVRLDWIDENDERYGVHHFSDGTLRAIALFAALTQSQEHLPEFIGIDEPELGLHPAALALFVGLIRSIAPRCQVLLATQSPALLDHFDPEEVIVAERDQGATRIRRLEPKALAGWLKDYSLSDLFDKNVLGGRP